MIPDPDGAAAVRAAREIAEAETEGKSVNPPLPEAFSAVDAGAFVTVNEHPSGMLRGCIGYPAPPFSLDRAVRLAAVGVCHDPRFPPLRRAEAERCVFEVSLLTEPRRIEYRDVDDLMSQITLGTDGLIVRMCNGKEVLRSALFLPQVPTEQGWDKEEYLDNLCWKAGIEPSA